MKFTKFRALFLFALIASIALIAAAGNLNTSAKCPRSGTCILGNSANSAIELNTGSTTGDAAVVLPTGSIGTSEILDGSILTTDIANGTIIAFDIAENAINADTYAAMSDRIVLCGEPADDGTIFFGPEVASYLGGSAEAAIGGGVCNALDDATEATVDAPIDADFPAFKVTGMFCQTSTDAVEDETNTLRSAEADLTPSITCTIPGAGAATSCSTTTSTTVDIAAGATIAIENVNAEDLSAAATRCEVYFAIKAL